MRQLVYLIHKVRHWVILALQLISMVFVFLVVFEYEIAQSVWPEAVSVIVIGVVLLDIAKAWDRWVQK